MAFPPIIPIRRAIRSTIGFWLFDLKLDGFCGIAEHSRCRNGPRHDHRGEKR
jgi:hypothetical protein